MRIELFGGGLVQAIGNGKSPILACWLTVFGEYLESQGINPTEPYITLPNGDMVAIIRDDKGGLNWEMIYSRIPGLTFTIVLFADGGTMAFRDGRQVPEAQEPWVIVYANYLRDQGIDPTEHEIRLPSGNRAMIIGIDSDRPDSPLNWEIVRP